MALATVTVSAPLPPEVAEKVKQAARRSHVTVAAYVRNLLIRTMAEERAELVEDEDDELAEFIS